MPLASSALASIPKLWPGLGWPVGPVEGEMNLDRGSPLLCFFVLCVIIEPIHIYCKIWKLQKGRKEKMKIICHPTARR